ncbi:MAG: hypothetical protein AB1416_08130, partial [Actinomycetota bacterium]
MADGRPRSVEDVLDALEDRLGDDDEARDAAVDAVLEELDGLRYAMLPDERLVDLLALLDGRVFTRRPTPQEVSAGVLAIEPDLDVPLLPFDAEVPFTGERTGAIILSDEDVPDGIGGDLAWGGLVRGPDGWLSDAASAACVALSLRDGRLDHAPCTPDPALTAPLAEALSAR